MNRIMYGTAVFDFMAHVHDLMTASNDAIVRGFAVMHHEMLFTNPTSW